MTSTPAISRASAGEHWVEVNLVCDLGAQDGILLDVLLPFVRILDRSGELATWHYFREPEIRFRVRLRSEESQRKARESVRQIANSLRRRGLVSSWHFGNHGEKGRQYKGEEDRYGKRGWRVAQEYFRQGSESALSLIELKRAGRLESPLWAKGLGNPWEGGAANPWRHKESDPLVYHWSRYVHLFSNQLGFDMEKEAELAEKQAEKYRRVRAESGMEW